jgi:hypothetical protein
MDLKSIGFFLCAKIFTSFVDVIKYMDGSPRRLRLLVMTGGEQRLTRRKKTKHYLSKNKLKFNFYR